MPMLHDGFSTTITITGITLIEEQTVTPPGLDGGGEIDTTSMRRTRMRTKREKSLLDLTPMDLTVQYDPAVYDEVLAATGIQNNQAITVTFPDGSTVVFWGWIDNFVIQEHQEGELPLADMTIIPSNIDGSNNEIQPVYAASP